MPTTGHGQGCSCLARSVSVEAVIRVAADIGRGQRELLGIVGGAWDLQRFPALRGTDFDRRRRILLVPMGRWGMDSRGGAGGVVEE